MVLTRGSKGIWRNGSASDSRSDGWEFKSLCPQFGLATASAAPGVRALDVCCFCAMPKGDCVWLYLDCREGWLGCSSGWPLGGAGRGNRTANRVSVSSGKNDLKGWPAPGLGVSISQRISVIEMRLAAQVLIAIRPLQGYPCTKDRAWVLRHPRGWARPSGLGGNLGFRV